VQGAPTGAHCAIRFRYIPLVQPPGAIVGSARASISRHSERLPVSPRPHVSAFVLLLATAAACATPSAPAVSATVHVPVAEVVATRSGAGASSWIQFAVPVTLVNQGTTAIRLGFCGVALDVQLEGRWTQAWSPVCAAAADNERIAPGGRRDFDVQVIAATGGAGSPRWRGAPGASYRVVLTLVPAGAQGQLPQVASNGFAVLGLP
jgi:hypothetical protein